MIIAISNELFKSDRSIIDNRILYMSNNSEEFQLSFTVAYDCVSLEHTILPYRNYGYATIEENLSMAQKIDKIYDRIFKRMMTLSSQSIIALINGLFQTSYPLDSMLTYNLTENIDTQLSRTIADTIITVNNVHSYHMEAQIYKDDNIIFRMFDYGYQHALKTPSGNRIDFPEPVIIYLADDKPLPDTYTLEIDF